MTDVTDEEFRALVVKDLHGKLGDEDAEPLHADYVFWRDELIGLLQSIDKQFTVRRAESMAVRTREARLEYEEWKRGAVAYKKHIVTRLRDVKAMLREHNLIEHNLQDEALTTVMQALVGEVRAIRSILEKRGGEKHDP